MTDTPENPKMKYLKAGLTLSGVTFACLCLIFSVSSITEDVIAAGKINARNARFARLFNPESFDNDPAADCHLLPGPGNTFMRVMTVRKGTETVGYIVNYSVIGGYSSPFTMVAGVSTDGTITYTDIEQFNETPGLGDKVLRSSGGFLDSFAGASLENRNFNVKKDGGDFDYYTGATVTPRAVARSTGSMLEKLRKADPGSFPVCDSE